MDKRKGQQKLAVGILILILAGIFSWQVQAQEGSVSAKKEENKGKALSIEEFIWLATQNDTYFEEILIDQLKLDYRKDLYLPSRDIVLDIKGQYDFILGSDREDPEATVSLSKLFPYTGTEIETSYKNIPSKTADTRSSEFNVLISQPIAQNAFGAATRLQDKIIGVEMDVIRYQIVEAYEDYLATLISTYYSWYSAYENLKIGQASYEQNMQVLENMNKRAENKIALPVDVNKVKLLVIGKEENLITLREAYRNVTNLVEQAIRKQGGDELIPKDPSGFHSFEISFEDDYKKFTEASRTHQILDLLEKKSSLEVKKNADALLPSTKLLFGYEVEGREWRIDHEENMFYAGFSLEWPFPDQVDRAEYETSRIDRQKTQLANENKYLELYTTLRNLALQIKREKELIKLAEDKIELSQSVLKDETRNYSYGKISLNDYIDAVNKVDQNNFNKILHTVELKKLLLEWLRLTDVLVDKKILKK